VRFFQYYSLDITYFKSSLDSHLLDLLWNKYWVNTLSSSPLLGNGDYVAGQISDLGTLQCHYFLCDNLFWFYIIRIECPFNVIFCNYEYLNWEIFFVAAEKLEQAENQLAHSRFGPLVAPTPRKKEVSDVFLYVFCNVLCLIIGISLLRVSDGLFKFFTCSFEV